MRLLKPHRINSYLGDDDLVYSFDTSVFIDLKKSNPRSRNNDLWTILDDYLKNGGILVSKEVYFELKEVDDDLAPWLNVFSNSIIESDKMIQDHVGRLSNLYENWIDPNSLKTFADPYVIALALSRQGSVVTNEKINEDHLQNPNQMINQSHAVRIPNICDQEGIECVNFIGFFS